MNIKSTKPRKIKYRKPRKAEQIRKRWEADGTYVSDQTGGYVVFDHGDYEKLVAPICRFLNANLSGDGKLHIRIWGKRVEGQPANNIQVSHLIMGLKPGDGREVRFRNGNPRDMRKSNLFLVGKPKAQDDENSGAIPLAA